MQTFRENEQEKARTADLLQLLPRGRTSVLDIGARDGHFSRLLTEFFDQVTALDLQTPSFHYARVTKVAGDVTNLRFPDSSFDCVFCTEVLEHVPDLDKACREIVRVSRHEIVIGVPLRQDIRLGRTTCQSCGGINPPWGHVNTFDEARLTRLFGGLQLKKKSFVPNSLAATNALAVKLMDLAGNPWGTYDQQEPCIHCGRGLVPPPRRSFWSRVCSGVAVRLNNAQARIVPTQGSWVHLLFSKDQAASAPLPVSLSRWRNTSRAS